MEIDPCSGDESQTNTASTTTTSIRQRNGEDTATLRKCHTPTSNGASPVRPAADSEPSGTNNHNHGTNNHSGKSGPTEDEQLRNDY